MTSDCLFCRIVQKEIPAEVVYEDNAALAFLDITPRSPGHTVVISKTHSTTILDLPAPALASLGAAVQAVTRKLSDALGPAGFTIGINHGSISGQTVPHLHVHVMPRYEGDGGGSIHSVVHNEPKESIKEIAQKVRQSDKE